MFPRKSPQEHTLAEIVIHTSVALQCVGPGSLADPLYALMADPSKMTVFVSSYNVLGLLITLIAVGSIDPFLSSFRSGVLKQVVSA